MNDKTVWLAAEFLALALVFGLIITCFQNYSPMAASPEDSKAVALLLQEQTADGGRQMAAIISVRESRIEESVFIEQSILDSIAESVSIEESIAESVSIEESIVESVSIEESIAESVRVAENEAAEAKRREEARRAEEARQAAEARRKEEARRAAEAAAATMPTIPPMDPASGGPAVLIGDSRTSEFYYTGLLPKNQVYFFGGSVYAMDGIVREAASSYPSKAVFMGGQNDLGVYAGDANAFISEYTRIISLFLSLSPDTKIYVNLIIPDTPEATAQMPGRENVGAYNNAIISMCAQNGWTYIDTAGGFDPSFYCEDGIHFHSIWYPIWLNNIRSAAGF